MFHVVSYIIYFYIMTSHISFIFLVLLITRCILISSLKISHNLFFFLVSKPENFSFFFKVQRLIVNMRHKIHSRIRSNFCALLALHSKPLHSAQTPYYLLLLHRALRNLYIVHSSTNALFIKLGKV